MDLTQIPILIYVIIITGLTAYICYSLGFRIGHSEGYLRGRAIAKALKSKEQEFYVTPSDIKQINS